MMEPVKVWDYLEEYETEREEILAAIETVLRSGWLILGGQVKGFEQEFASFCDADFGIGVNSATDALFLSLKAMDIGSGDEVITVANTAVPTVSAIVAAGARPVFVDIDSDSYLMDVTQVEQAITPQTKAIIPVHLFGQCVDMAPLMEIARSKGLKVIEDCSQSHGATYQGKRCGNLADAGVFSCYPTKPLGAYGDAGIVVTSNQDLHDRLKRLRFYGMEKTYYAVEDGYNSRLDELQAAILRTKLKKLPAYIQRRQTIAATYDGELAATGLHLPKVMAYNEHVYYVYVVRHPERERIMAALKGKNIFVNISYPWPIHLMTAYQHLGYREGDLPVTEKMANEIFSLPMYPALSAEAQKYVVETLRQLIR